MAETPITSLTTSDKVKKGVNPLFSCENERFVSLALLAGSGQIAGKNKNLAAMNFPAQVGPDRGLSSQKKTPRKIPARSDGRVARNPRLVACRGHAIAAALTRPLARMGTRPPLGRAQSSTAN